jgi:diaminopimelate epimerase
MTAIPFIKMHGLGNDFVVIDARRDRLVLGAAAARAIADRRAGIGCDQVLVVEPPRNGAADAFLRILNADGGEAEACGNGTRCVARLVMDERRTEAAVVETVAGLLRAEAGPAGQVSVDMGEVRFGWRDIPLAGPVDTLRLPLAVGPLREPAAANVGNPHAVFFVDDAEAVPLAELGPRIEHHPLFPERANVEVAQVLAPDRIRLRVWERGAGVTRACGSGACAAVAAAHRRGLAARTADVILDGGLLRVAWRDDGHATMSGPVAVSFTGAVEDSLWAEPKR